MLDNEAFDPNAIHQVDRTATEPRTARRGGEDVFTGWLWEGTLPRNGNYRVRVAHSSPAVNGVVWSPYGLLVEIP